MIDRSYLPYESTKYYVDRGMAKWMGFFISEHTTALSKKDNVIDISNTISEKEKQIFFNNDYLVG